MRSPCLKNATFDCIHCHTSSGRYKFAIENPNGACLPCHQDKVANVQAHSHHKPDGAGGKCIACHMPKTRFAAMDRSDHSMLPPTPATTIKYKSPNACNLCHKDRDAAWADAAVRKWHKDDYQKPVLERAALIEAARNRDWKQLPAMLSYVGRKDFDPIYRVSLVRLLMNCSDVRKWPPIIQATSDPSPLVRGAAAAALEGYGSPEARDALIKAAQDEYRLVRVRAAATLARWPLGSFTADQKKVVEKAEAEYVAALQSRPDDFTAHTNLGNYQLDRGETDSALRSFETAIKLRPDSTITLVNASIAYSRAGKIADADRVLVQALQTAPDNGAANFNRGLLLAEQGKKPEAIACLRKALASPETAPAAAFNLCVLTMPENKEQALGLCRQAVKGAPDNEKYVFTMAFYLAQDQDPAAVAQFLGSFVATHNSGLDTRMLLADLFLKSGQTSPAGVLYRDALKQEPDGQAASLRHRPPPSHRHGRIRRDAKMTPYSCEHGQRLRTGALESGKQTQSTETSGFGCRWLAPVPVFLGGSRGPDGRHGWRILAGCGRSYPAQVGHASAGLRRSRKGADYPYQQLFAGVGFGYQLHRITKPHAVNIDPDKEHQFSFGSGYEYLRTIQSGKAKYEDRLALQATLHQRLGPSFLISDRNRVEFRWVNGSYSTRYRNQLTLERDFIVRGFRFTPYAEAEVYYDGGKHSWNEEQYTAGIQWPYKKLLMLNTYYLRQHCTTCNPKYLDVGGVAVNFYFRSDK